jgi:hypothetical protein
MMPMMGGAGAGGGRDGQHKSPGYLRGNHLTTDTPACDEKGFAILPPSGLVEDWLAEQGLDEHGHYPG